MAGFQLSTIGRFWMSTEARTDVQGKFRRWRETAPTVTGKEADAAGKTDRRSGELEDD